MPRQIKYILIRNEPNKKFEKNSELILCISGTLKFMRGEIVDITKRVINKVKIFDCNNKW